MAQQAAEKARALLLERHRALEASKRPEQPAQNGGTSTGTVRHG